MTLLQYDPVEITQDGSMKEKTTEEKPTIEEKSTKQESTQDVSTAVVDPAREAAPEPTPQ
jgi:hypothetical protein